MLLLTLFNSSLAFAQAAPAKPGMLESLMPIIFVVAIFWLFLIRPQQKRHKKHTDFLGQIKRGDSVLTSSGIFGTIEGITDQFVTLEIADQVRIRILKSQISAPLEEEQK